MIKYLLIGLAAAFGLWCLILFLYGPIAALIIRVREGCNRG